MENLSHGGKKASNIDKINNFQYPSNYLVIPLLVFDSSNMVFYYERQLTGEKTLCYDPLPPTIILWIFAFSAFQILTAIHQVPSATPPLKLNFLNLTQALVLPQF